MQHGEMQYNALSRFVKEIPVELMDNRPPKTREVVPSVSNISYKPMSNNLYSSANPYRNSFSNKSSDTNVIKDGLSALNSMGVTKGISTAAPGTKPDYDISDRVKHVKYGEGTVTDIEPGSRDFKVTVDFDDVGTKIMYAAFAKLQKI